MIKKLKKRLFIIFGSITSFILILVIIFLFLLDRSEQQKNEEEIYQLNVTNVIDTLTQTSKINTTWLSTIQQKSKMLILINENGTFLSLLNKYPTSISGDILASELFELAHTDGFDTNLHTVYASVNRSKTYEWHKGEAYSYRGTMAVYKTNTSTRTLYLIEENSRNQRAIVPVLLRYVLPALLGSGLLYLFSFFFVGLILRPVQDGQRKQTEFISNVSHELKSPLNVINAGICNLHLLLNQETVDTTALSQSRKILPAIKNECSRASRLINDMLLLAATDMKTWKIQEQLINMDTLLINLYDHYTTLEASLQNKFHFELPDTELYQISGDPERIRQIITILIDNAIRYTNPERGITLRACNESDTVHLEIIDYGSGIPDDQKEIVFNRFYRMDASGNDNNFGLGLSIAKELTKLHKGKIYVKDTPGGGATFCIVLPGIK